MFVVLQFVKLVMCQALYCHVNLVFVKIPLSYVQLVSVVADCFVVKFYTAFRVFL